jgi:hypothetical protein
MNNNRSVKSSSRLLLAGGLALFGLLLWYGLTGETLSLGNDLPWFFKAAPWALVAMLWSLLIQSLVPRSVKEVLVFRVWEERLPSYGAFRDLTLADARIDERNLIRLHGELPRSPLGQHRLWYQLYQKHISQSAVVEALFRYLLFRDLCVLSVAFSIVYVFVFQFAIPDTWPGRVYLVLVIAAICYLLFSFAARSSARDLCENVLAIESASDLDSPEKVKGDP